MAKRYEIRVLLHEISRTVTFLDVILQGVNSLWPAKFNTIYYKITYKKDSDNGYQEREVMIETERHTGYGLKKLCIKARFIKYNDSYVRWDLQSGKIFLSSDESLNLSFYVLHRDKYDDSLEYDLLIPNMQKFSFKIKKNGREIISRLIEKFKDSKKNK